MSVAPGRSIAAESALTGIVSSSSAIRKLTFTWTNCRLFVGFLGAAEVLRKGRKTTECNYFGDILGARKRCLGMIPKLLTEARETSYWIFGSLLTAECSWNDRIPAPLLCSCRSKDVRAGHA